MFPFRFYLPLGNDNPSYKFGFSSSYNALGCCSFFKSTFHFCYLAIFYPWSLVYSCTLLFKLLKDAFRSKFKMYKMSSVYFRHQFPFTFGVVLPRGNFFQIILVKSREFYKFTDRLETGIYLSKLFGENIYMQFLL